MSYLSVTQSMPRWFTICWLALPLTIGMTMLFLVILATRLFQRLY